MTAVEIAWVAGIIEGEGSIVLRSTQRWAVEVVVEMCDEDVVRRLAAATGIGNVTGPYRRNRNGRGEKATWVWKVGRKRDAARLLCAIAPLLGERRRGKAAEAADRISESLRDPRSRRALAGAAL